MIRHIVMWRMRTSDADERAAHLATMRERFAALVPLIEGTRSLEVVADVAVTDGNWDVALIGEYDDHAALDAYQVHPAHREVSAFVGTLVTERACVDFEV